MTALSALVLVLGLIAAGAGDGSLQTNGLTALTLEQLMSIKITSVSKHTEEWFRSAAALDVVTGEDIRRSGARYLGDAFCGSPGLAVARQDSHTWAISPRGFNSELASKTLVLMDGRSVCAPLNGGVYWDAQDTMLEDVDRVEIIRGPGGSLWGANAVEAGLERVLHGQTVGDRPVQFVRYDSLAQATNCHVLFLGELQRARLEEVFESLRGRPILTVGDVQPFTTRGGMLGFIRRDSRLTFEANPAAIRAAGLTVSSRLLQLATIVETRPP